jgi:hypothetical protein
MTAEPNVPPARWFVPGLIIGWALISFGAWSALRAGDDANPIALAGLVVGFDLWHDLLIAPLLIGGAWLVTRLVPEPARGPVRAAAAVTVLIGLFSFPLLLRLGRRPTNSSTVPLDYGRNVLILLGLVWAIAGVVAVTRMIRSDRR